MPDMNFDNAREKEQLRRMKECALNNKCYLCPPINSASVIAHRGNHWFIMKNDFPYEGSEHHYLIVSTKHMTALADISPEAQLELFQMVEHLRKTIQGVSGFSFFVRSGDLSYTGATIDHLHFHFLVGGKRQDKASEKLKVSLGYKRPR